jgi:hypothetical protein
MRLASQVRTVLPSPSFPPLSLPFPPHPSSPLPPHPAPTPASSLLLRAGPPFHPLVFPCAYASPPLHPPAAARLLHQQQPRLGARRPQRGKHVDAWGGACKRTAAGAHVSARPRTWVVGWWWCDGQVRGWTVGREGGRWGVQGWGGARRLALAHLCTPHARNLPRRAL